MENPRQSSSPSETSELRDQVDLSLEAWKREFPSMDLETEGLVARLSKISRYIDRTLSETAGDFGMAIGDWDLLSALRRQGPPYMLSPSQLCKDRMLSSGAMTNRLDKLEKQGLVERLPDPDDRRGIKVRLTDKGAQTWEAAVEVQAKKERMVADSLSEDEKKLTNDMLRKMMITLSRNAGDYPRRAEIAKAYDD